MAFAKRLQQTQGGSTGYPHFPTHGSSDVDGKGVSSSSIPNYYMFGPRTAKKGTESYMYTEVNKSRLDQISRARDLRQSLFSS
jgi:hypothetical protein